MEEEKKKVDEVARGKRKNQNQKKRMNEKNSHRAVRHRLELVPSEQAPDQVEGVALFFEESESGKVVRQRRSKKGVSEREREGVVKKKTLYGSSSYHKPFRQEKRAQRLGGLRAGVADDLGHLFFFFFFVVEVEVLR